MTSMTTIPENYNNIRAGIVDLLNAARSAASRSVNALMTATYWEIGRRIVQSEQAGAKRAGCGPAFFCSPLPRPTLGRHQTLANVMCKNRLVKSRKSWVPAGTRSMVPTHSTVNWRRVCLPPLCDSAVDPGCLRSAIVAEMCKVLS